MAINTNQKQNILSVNGKVGEVQLSASDVGALPIDTKIPTKTSELENDNLVVKEKGKSLIADSEIERLAAVTNYDDAALSGRVTNIENKIPSLAIQSYAAEEVGALIDDSSTTATNKVYSVNKIMEILTNWQDVALNEEVQDTVTVKKLKIGNIVYMHTHIAGLRYTGQGGEGTIIFSTNDADVINTNITDGDKLRGIVDVENHTDPSNIVRTTANIDYDPTLGTFRLYCFGETTRQFTNVALYGDIFSIIQK